MLTTPEQSAVRKSLQPLFKSNAVDIQRGGLEMLNILSPKLQVSDYLEDVLPLIGSADSAVKQKSLEFVGIAGNEANVPALLEALSDETHATIFTALTRILSQLKTPDAFIKNLISGMTRHTEYAENFILLFTAVVKTMPAEQPPATLADGTPAKTSTPSMLTPTSYDAIFSTLSPYIAAHKTSQGMMDLIAEMGKHGHEESIVQLTQMFCANDYPTLKISQHLDKLFDIQREIACNSAAILDALKIGLSSEQKTIQLKCLSYLTNFSSASDETKNVFCGILMPMLTGRDSEIALNACFALAKVGNKTLVPTLKSILKSESHPDFKKALETTIKTLKGNSWW